MPVNYFKDLEKQCEVIKKNYKSKTEKNNEFDTHRKYPYFYENGFDLANTNIFDKKIISYSQDCSSSNFVRKPAGTAVSRRSKNSHDLVYDRKRIKTKSKAIKENDNSWEKLISPEEAEQLNLPIGTIAFFKTYKINPLSSKEDPIYIESEKHLNTAITGDRVAYEIIESSKSMDKKGRPIKYGKVRSILKRNENNYFAGKLKRDFSENYHKIVSIFPEKSDMLIEKSAINDEVNENHIYVAKLLYWSPEQELPVGSIVYENANDSTNNIENVTEYILMKQGLVDFLSYQEKGPRIYPETEPVLDHSDQNRLDLTRECIFTIDPSTACDLDDAISYQVIDESTFKIGVHISDVSYFVKADTELEERARKLCTSVYMTQKAYHMLPSYLSGYLCSLNPGKNRFAVSIIFTIDNNFEIIDTLTSRSVICSCVKLSYEQAQELLDNPEAESLRDTNVEVFNGFTIRDVTARLHKIRLFTRFLRDKRFSSLGGSLKLDTPELHFDTDPETKLPVRVFIKELLESNNLIEELMLLANENVAKKIYQKYPKLAVLRIHRSPGELIKSYTDTLRENGIIIDTTSSSSLSASLRQLQQTLDPNKFMSVLFYLTKPMPPAAYVCAGGNVEKDEDSSLSLYHHYGLNMDFYTHFTSPIRRYPDILVHRLLLSQSEEDTQNLSPDLISKLLENCNEKQKLAEFASKDSSKYFLWLYIKECGSLKAQAVIMPSIHKNNQDMLELLILPYFLRYNHKNSECLEEYKPFQIIDVEIFAKEKFRVDNNIFRIKLYSGEN